MKMKFNPDDYCNYYTPSNTSWKLTPKTKKISDELFNLITYKQFEKLGGVSTQWIYLLDCLERGSISPMEAYDCLNLGYIPEHLSCRESLYQK